MVTKQDVDNILKQVNAILQKLDDRLTALETGKTKTPTTRQAKSQTKDLTNS